MLTLTKPSTEQNETAVLNISTADAISRWYANSNRGIHNCMFREHLVKKVGIEILDPMAEFIFKEVLKRKEDQETNKAILALICDACEERLPFFYAGDTERIDMNEIALFSQAHGV